MPKPAPTVMQLDADDMLLDDDQINIATFFVLCSDEMEGPS
jgi:hypothetical protein